MEKSSLKFAFLWELRAINETKKQGAVVHTCNPSILEAEARE